jgi:hypothetical protein
MPVALNPGFTSIYKIDRPFANQPRLHFLQIYSASMSKTTQIFLYFQARNAVFLALFASQCKDSHIDAPTTAPLEKVLSLSNQKTGAAND